MASGSSRNELRLVLGFFLLPPAAGVLMYGTCIAMWVFHAWAFEGSPGPDAAVALGLSVGLLAIPVTALIAVPAVTWLLRRGDVSFGRVVLAGCAVGNAPFALIVAAIVVVQLGRGTPIHDIPRLWFGWYGAARAVVLGSAFGAVLAALLWFVAIRGSVADAGG